jgi:hypothetical protein
MKDMSLLQSLFHLMYNDEFPNSTIWTDDLGHTKGLPLDDSTLFLMYRIYDVRHESGHLDDPQCAQVPYEHLLRLAIECICLWTDGSLLVSALQSFAAHRCVFPESENMSGLVAAEQLYFTQPFIYSSNLPTSMASEMPRWSQVIAGEYQRGAPFYRIQNFTTRGAATFTHYAKNGDFGRGGKPANLCHGI